MAELPRGAQAYFIIVCLMGTASLAGAIGLPWPHAAPPGIELLSFILLATFVNSVKVTISSRKPDQELSTMSLGFAFTFVAMLRFGMIGAIAVGVVGCLVGCFYPQRQPAYQVLFNGAATTLELFVTSLVFLKMNAWSLPLRLPASIAAIAASALTDYLVNTGLIAEMIALCSARPLADVWNEHFLITAPSYFYGAAAGAVVTVAFGAHTTVILIALAPVAYFTYRSFQAMAERQKFLDDLRNDQQQFDNLYTATIKSLALAIDAKDRFTYQHIARVQQYATAIARQLEMSPADLEAIKTGSLLHDIGKLAIPDHLLLKPGKLTPEEFEKVKRHPEIGAAILDQVDFPWPVLPVVKYHHEKWDGTGYPEGLNGENIPRNARVLAVADVYDALTSPRAYRQAWSHERAVQHIRESAGAHFDPVVVEAFLAVIGRVVAEMAAMGIGPLRPAPKDAELERHLDRTAHAAREIEQAATELFALYEISQTLSASLGLEQTLKILVRKVNAIFPGTTTAFLLYDELEVLAVRTVLGPHRAPLQGAMAQDREGPSCRVAQAQATYNGPYVPGDLMLTSDLDVEWQPPVNALVVPLAHHGNVLGTVNLYDSGDRPFDQYTQHLLETIVSRAGAPIFSATIFDRTRSDAITDPLTGLYNVRFITRYVQERIRRITATLEDRSPSDAPGAPVGAAGATSASLRNSDRFALVCIDVDSLKPINDNYGHLRGDQVLKALSEIFQRTLRDGDVVARYGGDEFVMCLDDVGSHEAALAAARLQRAVEAQDAGLIQRELAALKLGVSVGIAIYPGDGNDWETLFAVADTRMYDNKRARKLGRLAERPSEAGDG